MGEFIASILPDLIRLIVERREAGESEEDIRRDIRDRRDEIAANRAARDAELDERFPR